MLVVNWEFKFFGEIGIYVMIINYNFIGLLVEVVNKVIDFIGGFILVFVGLKVWLEYGVELNLIGDKFLKEVI